MFPVRPSSGPSDDVSHILRPASKRETSATMVHSSNVDSTGAYSTTMKRSRVMKQGRCESRSRVPPYVLLIAWLAVRCETFSPSHTFLRNVPVHQQHARCRLEQQRSDSIALTKDEARAGDGGYSVLRQPVSRSNWDPDAKPDFDVPSNLLEEDINQRRQDDEWWRGISSSSTSPVSSSGISSSGGEDTDEDHEELDLLQRSLDTLDYPRVLEALHRDCTTDPARRLVREARFSRTVTTGTRKVNEQQQLAYQPLIADTVEGAQTRYLAVQELQHLLNEHDIDNDDNLQDVYYTSTQGYKEYVAGRPPPLGGNRFDLDLILSAVDQGRVLESEEILQVSEMMDVMENVRRWGNVLLKHDGFLELSKLCNCISVNETLADFLTSTFDDDGRLCGKAFPAIGRLRAQVRSLRAEIMATLDNIVSTPSIKSKLAMESGGSLYSEVNGGRLVIPIDVKYSSSIGIVHDTSRSGKTVYVEPTEVVGTTNELRQAEGELRTEESRVWRMLTQEILHNRVQLETAVMAIGQLDLVMARILFGKKLSGVVPDVQDEGVIDLQDAKHPVLLLRKVQNAVGSDVQLGADGNQGLVLTGPNSGGKTIILKLLGLVAMMSRGGIPIPAAGVRTNRDGDNLHTPRVDFFDPVLADIGDIQSVGDDLSTFSGHMLVCREVLSSAGRNALVLMDEVGSGTDPNQGVAIAQALLEALMETGARVAITTHFLQLKQLAASDRRFSVAGMQFVNGRPTYKLLPGTVGESFALAVAERLQLPSALLDRAVELLDSETRQMGELIGELEDQKALVEQQGADLETKQKEIAQREQKLKEEQMRLEQKQLVARREEAKKFARKLEEKEQLLESILDKLKADPSRRVVAKSWKDIQFVKRDALDEAENVPSVLARKKKAAEAEEQVRSELVPISELRERPDLREGEIVVVCKKGPLLGRQATIINARGAKVEVRVNNMNVGLKLSEVALPLAKHQGMTMRRKNGSRTLSRSAEKAMENEQRVGMRQAKDAEDGGRQKSADVTMRTQSNTVDVRGCNLEEAKEKAKAKFSSNILSGRGPVVFILHGHGTGGVLRNKLRGWLKSADARAIVKSWKPADISDGGDAFTRVELR